MKKLSLKFEFSISVATFERCNLNWRVEKDGPKDEADLERIESADHKHRPLIHDRDLLLGFSAGVAGGILNLVAATSDRIVDLYDLPVFLFWVLVGLGLAWVSSLLRYGMSSEANRNRMFKCGLYPGAIMGMLIGGLNGLVVANGWVRLENWFEILDSPVVTLINLLQDWFPLLNSVPKHWYDDFLFWLPVVICYWTVVSMGFMAALSVIRALVSRGSVKIAEKA